MRVINKEEYKHLLMNNPKVVVQFSGGKCAPCKVLERAIDNIAAPYEQNGIVFVKVLIEDNIEAMNDNYVMSTPTTVIFFNGKPSRRHVGANVISKITSDLDIII